MWRRSGSTGTSTPSMRPIDFAHGPAAFTRIGVEMLPFEVRTSATRFAVQANAIELDLANDLDALLLRALREPHRHAIRIGHAIGQGNRWRP